MTDDGAARDPARCPLCGEPNQCAIAAGLVDDACWCSQIDMSAAALSKIPPDERGERCLCPRCAVE